MSALLLHGLAEVIERTDSLWNDLQPSFPVSRMARAIIVQSIERISDSCGWGVPMYEFIGERDQYCRYSEQLSEEDLRQSQIESNMTSLNGLSGLSNPSV